MTAQTQRIPADDGAAEAANLRCRVAADFIAAGSRVVGLGAASAALSTLLPHGCMFQVSDSIPVPPPNADVIAALSVLESVVDADALMADLQRCACDVVLSYPPSDLAGADTPSGRRQLSLYDLAVLFDRFGFRIASSAPLGAREVMLKLRPSRPALPLAPCSVAIVSYNDVGNFGDRLGYHIVNGLMPAGAEVHHLTFRTLQQARASYDLVVLGIGNSVFDPLLGDDVLDVVARGKAAIGIFGTQYRELIPRPALDRLLDRLDTWFARYEDDVLMYGRGRNNVHHLGDWLIDQFPMARPVDDALLEIGDDILTELSLDRTIQGIQRHKNVYSTRLHPLLCALTSAELVAYAEQESRDAPGIASGKFRSMLMDIFGRSYPQKQFFAVDRAAVAQYKALVHGNVAKVGARIEAILRNVAVAPA